MLRILTSTSSSIETRWLGWWTTVAGRYPPGTVIDGKVRNLASYGAFIEIEEGIDGLLHVSDGWLTFLAQLMSET